MSEHPHIRNFFPPLLEPSIIYDRRPYPVGGHFQKRLKPSRCVTDKKLEVADHPFTSVMIEWCNVCDTEFIMDFSDGTDNDFCPTCGRKLQVVPYIKPSDAKMN